MKRESKTLLYLHLHGQVRSILHSLRYNSTADVLRRRRNAPTTIHQMLESTTRVIWNAHIELRIKPRV
jgi:hypothetical protein